MLCRIRILCWLFLFLVTVVCLFLTSVQRVQLQPDLHVTEDAQLSLRNFCHWQQKENEDSDSNIAHFDAAILLTKYVSNVCFKTRGNNFICDFVVHFSPLYTNNKLFVQSWIETYSPLCSMCHCFHSFCCGMQQACVIYSPHGGCDLSCCYCLAVCEMSCINYSSFPWYVYMYSCIRHVCLLPYSWCVCISYLNLFQTGHLSCQRKMWYFR